jgi:DNA-binding beta-propeller fold protein YncE
MTCSFFAALAASIAIVLGGAPSSAQNAYIPSGNTVSVIHTPTSTLGAAIPVSAPTTGAVAVSSDGRKVYVGTSNAISVIDTLATFRRKISSSNSAISRPRAPSSCTTVRIHPRSA